MIGDESVLAHVLGRARVEIEVERDRVELRIEIDAPVIEAQRCIELQSGAFPVCKAIEHLRRRFRFAERFEKGLDQLGLRAPAVLRAELHHVSDGVEDAKSLKLPIQRKNGWPEAHRNPPRQSTCAGPPMPRTLGTQGEACQWTRPATYRSAPFCRRRTSWASQA